MPGMAPRARKGRPGQAAPPLDRAVVVRAVGGEPAAQRQVFEREGPMIALQARRRADQGLSQEDLVQEGSLGLLAAMHEFAGGVEQPFDAYAESRVAEHMDRALAEEQAALQEERQLVQDAAAFEEAESALRRELNRVPSPPEIQARLGWTAARLDDVAAAVEDARQRHDEELAAYLDPEYFDPLDWIDDAGDPRTGGAGGA
jgi:DNA-directed RNA polymerase specialized sigma subunit